MTRRPIKQAVVNRPTGSTITLASAVVLILHKLGVDFTIEEVVVILGGAGVIVSWFTPRAYRKARYRR